MTLFDEIFQAFQSIYFWDADENDPGTKIQRARIKKKVEAILKKRIKSGGHNDRE